MNRKRIVFVSAVVVVLAFIGGVVAYNKLEAEHLRQLARQSDSVFQRSHSTTYGSPDAKVRIVEFFDPACEACRSFYPLGKGLVDAQAGKVQLVMRYAPFHEGSDTAVKILEAARLPGLFWPVAEAMLRAQPIWAAHDKPRPDLIWGLLGSTGLNISEARDKLSTPQVAARLKQDLDDARALNVTQTPEFFVNGRPLKDFFYAPLKALMEDEVRAAY